MSAIPLFQMHVFTGRENRWEWGVILKKKFVQVFFIKECLVNQTKNPIK